MITGSGNIWTVARFEAKTLFRSWFFRIFSILALVLIAIAGIPLFTGIAPVPWEFRGIPSSLPYMNILLLNVIQAVIAIFISSDFLKRDRKLDTTEAIYTRPVSNLEYVVGKISAVFFAFLILNVAVLIISLVYNIFFADVSIMPLPYLLYPLVISLPTVLFILGLSSLMMVTIKNQAVTFIVLLGYVATTLFYLSTRFYNLFDYLGFNVPLFYSDITGFSGWSELLMHRGIYFCLGAAFILVTVLAMKRLPQSRASRRICLVLAPVFLAAAVLLAGSFISGERAVDQARETMKTINGKATGVPALDIDNCSISLEHRGNRIEAEAGISFQNRAGEAVSEYLFNLNPGLNVERITGGGKELPFKRNYHLITVTPPSPLLPREQDSLTITYSGSIDESACYPGIEPDKIREEYRITFFCVKKRYAFIEDRYLLLTPEAHWYPESGPGYRWDKPAYGNTDFRNFELDINTSPSLSVVSQGKVNGENGRFRVRPGASLPGLTVTAGKYITRSIEVDSLQLSLHTMEGHDYFLEYFDQIGDTLGDIIMEEKSEYESKVGFSYPYPELKLVEVPISFFSYDKISTMGFETVQPEMVLLPEMGLNLQGADFRRRAWFQKRRDERRNQTTPGIEKQADNLSSFITEALTGELTPPEFRRRASAEVSYNLFPCYYTHVNHIDSFSYPVLNTALESYLAENLESGPSRFARFFSGVTDNERANMELADRSMRDIMMDPESRDILSYVLNLKGKHLFRLIGSRTGEEELNNHIRSVLAENMFSEIEGEKFVAQISDRFGIDMASYIDNWFTRSSVPGFLISGIENYQFVRDERTRYQVRFKVLNGSEVDGIVKITLSKSGGRRGFGPRFGRRRQEDDVSTERYVFLGAGQARDVGFVLNYQPAVMTVDMMVSRNLPAVIEHQLGEFDIIKSPSPLEGIREIDRSDIRDPDAGTIVVDNEDDRFSSMDKEETSLLKKVLPEFWKPEQEHKYSGLRYWSTSNRWKATISSKFYGKYIRSAHFISPGDGDIKASWKAEIPESGYYDVYCYISRIRTPWGRRRERDKPSLGSNYYIIYHDDGTEETGIDVDSAAEGWNFLGSYYFSAGEARIEITNQGEGRFIIADAVKWVAQ
ncbi:MAG: hypothetical protein GF417_02685 [Candidatus Latescibacteria bacterium]|nr:hypothetical protein [bacterium]MBD3423336.1 hypothetical protein [Candidatus Latescibacterota bacterium]